MGRRRAYHQHCGLAGAMDLLGERWTLLIIRELLIRPRRYNELLADLTGVGTNLLADRLKMLTEHGIVRRVPGTGRRPYELTAAGQALRPAVLSLARWGMAFAAIPTRDSEARAHWGFFAVEALIQPERAADVDEQYEFRVGEEVFHVDVSEGRVSAHYGPAEDPAMTAVTDMTTFVDIGSQRLSSTEAIVKGRLALEGDMDTFLRCSHLLGLDAISDPAAVP